MTVTRIDWIWCLLLLAAGGTVIFVADFVPQSIFTMIPMGIIRFFVVANALSGCTALGAGIGAPFKRKLLGAAAGALLYAGLFLAVRL